jgi:anaerobic magnesium-protoporphyrin IX monomethyl ester cyclase
MRVLFIFYEQPDNPASFPLGIGLLSAQLKKQGHTVKGIHIHKELEEQGVLEEIVSSVKQFAPDLLAYSCTSPAFLGIQKIAAHLRREIDTLAICGGSHPTLYPGETVTAEGIDYVCVGEGEITLVEFVNALEHGEDCSKISGILSLDVDGELIENRLYPLVQDLDGLPWIDFDVFGKNFIEQLTSDGWLRQITSRGCPYNCSYCHTPMFRKVYSEGIGVAKAKLGYLRFRSVDSLIDEVIAIVHKYDVKVINFMDDLFCLRKDRTIEFCQKFTNRLPENVGYSIQTHLMHIDKEIVDSLYSSRCLRIVVGVESGSERILKLLNRNVALETVKEKLVMLRKRRFPLGVWTLNMLGNPTETIEEMKQTLSLNAKAMIECVKVNILAPYPKSKIYDFCLQENLFEHSSNILEFADRSVTKLKFQEKELALLEKFFDIGHWYMNLFAPLGIEEFYRSLINEVEQIGPGDWAKARNRYIEKDKALSDVLNRKSIQHYSFVFKEKATTPVIGLSGVRLS